MAEEENQELSEEEKMMAEWEAMAGDEGGDASGGDAAAAEGAGDDMAAAMGGDAGGEAAAEQPIVGDDGRVLDQSEIDSLLGFENDLGGGDQSGVMKMVNSALVNYERLPMLDVVFEHLVRFMSTSLRNFTSDNVEVSQDHITSVRFGDYLNSIPLPAMLAIFKAEEWDNMAMMVVDSSLIYAMVDVLLGGRRGTSALRVEGRPYTTIETKLIERLASVILNDLSLAFDPLSPVSFKLDRIETAPRFATITQSSNAGVLVRLRVDMGDRSGRVEIMMPYATLEPIRELLVQQYLGEKFGRDSMWENHLTKELYQTDVALSAVLGETTVSLYDMLNWKKGSLVMFKTKPDDLIEMRIGSEPMFMARIGQKEDQIAISIEEHVEPKKRTEDYY